MCTFGKLCTPANAHADAYRPRVSPQKEGQSNFPYKENGQILGQADRQTHPTYPT